MKHGNINSEPNWEMTELVKDEKVPVSQLLVDKFEAAADARLLRRVRRSRKAALQVISRYCVVVSTDGENCQTLEFENPPKISEIVDAVGEDAFIVSYGLVRLKRTEVLARSFAAQ